MGRIDSTLHTLASRGWLSADSGQWLLLALGTLLLTVMSAAVLWLPPVAQLSLLIGVSAVVFYFSRPALALAGFFLFRIVLDLMWWLPGSIASLNPMELYTGAITGLCAVLFVLELRRLDLHPCLTPFLPYVAVLAFGGLRNLEVRSGAEILARYLSPLLLMFLISAFMSERRHRQRFFYAVVATFSIPVLISLYHLASGQMNVYTLAGYHRLMGGYKNLHSHALMMLVISAAGLWTLVQATLKQDRRLQLLMAAYTGAAALCMYLTYVRTAILALGVCAAVYLIVTRRTRVLGAGALLVVVFVLFTPAMQDRFKDLILFFAPDDNVLVRRKLGSGRMAIWTAGLTAYFQSSLGDIILGLGIGKHWLLTRGAFNPYSIASDGYVDPHSDYLTMTFQVGPIATISYVIMQLQIVRSGLVVHARSPDRFSRELAAFNIALCAGATVANLVSNSFINRITVGWMMWGLAALTFGEHMQLMRDGIVPLPGRLRRLPTFRAPTRPQL
jgi:hypothetical protein